MPQIRENTKMYEWDQSSDTPAYHWIDEAYAAINGRRLYIEILVVASKASGDPDSTVRNEQSIGQPPTYGSSPYFSTPLNGRGLRAGSNQGDDNGAALRLQSGPFGSSEKRTYKALSLTSRKHSTDATKTLQKSALQDNNLRYDREEDEDTEDEREQPLHGRRRPSAALRGRNSPLVQQPHSGNSAIFTSESQARPQRLSSAVQLRGLVRPSFARTRSNNHHRLLAQPSSTQPRATPSTSDYEETEGSDIERSDDE